MVISTLSAMDDLEYYMSYKKKDRFALAIKYSNFCAVKDMIRHSKVPITRINAYKELAKKEVETAFSPEYENCSSAISLFKDNILWMLGASGIAVTAAILAKAQLGEGIDAALVIVPLSLYAFKKGFGRMLYFKIGSAAAEKQSNALSIQALVDNIQTSNNDSSDFA